MRAEKQLAVTQDYFRMRFLSTPDYAKESGQVVYCLSQATQRGGFTQQIWLRNLSNGAETRLSSGGEVECQPRFLPGGKQVLFVSDGVLTCADAESGTTRALTPPCLLVDRYVVSPDGARVAFLSRGIEDNTANDPLEPMITEDFGFKSDDAMGYTQKRAQLHLWSVSTDAGEPIQLTFGERDDLLPSFSPDGEHIVFISGREHERKDQLAADLFSVPAQGGEVRRVTKDLYVAHYPKPIVPRFTKDGKTVLVGALSPGKGHGLPPTHLYCVDYETGEASNLFPPDAPCHDATSFLYNGDGYGGYYETMQTSADGQEAYFISGWHGSGNIYRAAITGDAKIVPLTEGSQCFRSIGEVKAGKMLAVRCEMEHLSHLVLVDAQTGEQTPVTDPNDWLSGIALGDTQELWMDTLDGESRVQGWVIRPPQAKAGEKYPAALYIHGGPIPFYGYALSYEYQCLAAMGIGVILCNPRGSGGYGLAHGNTRRAVDGTAMTDLLQFTQAACDACDWIDDTRLGVLGGSYGGYMTNWIAGHSKRFKAAVSQRSVVNELIDYGGSDLSEGGSKGYESFVDFMIAKLRESPVAYADRIDIPFLILHSMGDMRCPVEGAHQLYTAILDMHPDLPVRLVLFPKTNHGLVQTGPMHLRVRHFDETIAWLKKYL